MEDIVKARLTELRSVTPAGAMNLFNEFYGVCEGYYARGSDFNQLIFDAFMGHMFDQFMSDFDAERWDRLGELIGSEPEYWRDAEAIFKGFDGELYPFTPMLSVSLSAFAMGYVYVGEPPPSTGYWENKILEEWTLGIRTAQNEESGRLNGIKEYAIKRYEPWSPPLIYEDLGWRRQMWGNRCGELMYRVFEAKNWGWVFKWFEIEGDTPEILREWSNEN